MDRKEELLEAIAEALEVLLEHNGKQEEYSRLYKVRSNYNPEEE